MSTEDPNKGAGAPAGAGAGGGDATVPSSRLREETQAKREALDRVQSLERELATERARANDAVKNAGTALERERAAWAEERAVFQAGVTDPEAIGVARHLYNQLPEAGRSPFPEWLKGMKADPTKAPKALSPWFSAPAGGAGGAPGTTPAAGSGTPEPGGQPTPPNMGANRGSSPTSGPLSGGEMTVEAASARMAELAREATRTKDWKKYNEERPALLARIAKG